MRRYLLLRSQQSTYMSRLDKIVLLNLGLCARAHHSPMLSKLVSGIVSLDLQENLFFSTQIPSSSEKLFQAFEFLFKRDFNVFSSMNDYTVLLRLKKMNNNN